MSLFGFCIVRDTSIAARVLAAYEKGFSVGEAFGRMRQVRDTAQEAADRASAERRKRSAKKAKATKVTRRK